MAALDNNVPIKVEHPLVHKPGIYFGLDENIYHQALALSATGIKALRLDPMAWWEQSPLNPNRQNEETPAMKIGKAFHARIVEGPEVFGRRYAATLDPGAHPEALRTVADLTEALAKHLVKPPSRAIKADLIRHLLAVEPGAQIWDELARRHAQTHEGKIFLEPDLIAQIERAAGRVEAHPELSRAFADGAAEVSVFWVDESGIPCKARFDYLKPRAIVDLKSFALRDTLPDKAIVQAVARYKYHIQADFYLRGAAQMRQLAEAGLVIGDHDPDFLRAVLDEEEKVFLFVWQANGAPYLAGKILGPGIILDLGHFAVEEALLRWADAWRRWGTGEWNEIHPISRFADEEFPSWIND